MDGHIYLDSQQDCGDFGWKRRGNLTKFTFTRKFDTCDERDYIIEVIIDLYYFFLQYENKIVYKSLFF